MIFKGNCDLGFFFFLLPMGCISYTLILEIEEIGPESLNKLLNVISILIDLHRQSCWREYFYHIEGLTYFNFDSFISI